MKRRNFLKSGMLAGITPLFVKGYSMNKMSATLMPASNCSFDDRKLVIIYLAGANDIINTTIPLDQYTAYQSNRNVTHLAMNDLLKLDTSLDGTNQDLGLHKNLSAFKNFYDSDQLSIIQRVSYEQPNRSHFAAEDIMLKGIDGTIATSDEEEGWIGRFLKGRYPTYQGLPFGTELDPLGIVLGNTPKTGFHTQEEHAQEINLTGQDPAGFYSVISLLSGQPITQFENSDYGQLLSYMNTVEISTQVYSQRISTVFNQGTNTVTYPDTDLGNQLKTIARFISGGSRTKVYMARLGGFDNHVNAIVSGNTATGQHANNLATLNDAIQAFQNDLAGCINASGQSCDEDVVTVVFSEFGRKVIENATYGHDHGTLSSMFLIGKNVNTGVFGDNINLSDQDLQGAPMPSQTQHDYRSVFGGLLRDWFGSGNSQNVFPGVNLNFSPVKNTHTITPSCYFAPVQPVSMTLFARVMLEGFYDSSQNAMNQDLKNNGLLPYNQPYGDTKYSYFGDESVTVFPGNTVDWVLLEILNEDNIVLQRKAVLIRHDGWLTTLDGSFYIGIENLYPQDHKISIVHRNHIGVISNTTFSAVQSSYAFFNLTNSNLMVDDIPQQKNVGIHYALYAGDSDQSGFIDTKDYSNWLNSNNASTQAYNSADFDGNGLVDAADELLWKGNRSKFGSPLRHKNLLK